MLTRVGIIFISNQLFPFKDPVGSDDLMSMYMLGCPMNKDIESEPRILDCRKITIQNSTFDILQLVILGRLT